MTDAFENITFPALLRTDEVVPSVTSHAQPSDVIPIFAASSKISLDLPLREINNTILTPAIWDIYLIMYLCSRVYAKSIKGLIEAITRV